MIKTRRNAFKQAHDLLCKIKILGRQSDGQLVTTPQQIDSLRALHKLLIKEISRAERKARRTKACLRRANVEIDADEVVALEDRLESYRHLAYNWRCFGDAVAFHFMDKFALKQTFYNTQNTNPKQDAGFLIGKAGLQLELDVLHVLLENGVPALLTDVTNSIKYGDVVAMIGPDPKVIEVKSGKLDRRGKKQQRSISQLNTLFTDDVVENFRGFEKLSRVAHDVDEVSYVYAINDCISEAQKSGSAWRNPEEGLHYLAIADDEADIGKLMEPMKLNQPIAFFLNEAKASRIWSPYSPYTLSIHDGDALFSFVWGGLILIVFYDLDVLRRLVEREGKTIKVLDAESEYAIEISRPEGAGFVRMGRHLFNRMAYDFSSPEWLLRITEERLDWHEAVHES